MEAAVRRHASMVFPYLTTYTKSVYFLGQPDIFFGHAHNECICLQSHFEVLIPDSADIEFGLLHSVYDDVDQCANASLL